MRARRNCHYTIPYLIRELGASGTTAHYDNYQSIGARAVNHLAGRMVLTLIPPSLPFFRVSASESIINQLEIRGETQAIEELNSAFAGIERSILRKLETKQLGSAGYEMFRHAICAGNYLLHIPPDEKIQGYALDTYVVRRDGYGNAIEIIVRQEQKFGQLDFPVQETLRETRMKDYGDDDRIEIFTWVRLVGSMWRVHQEADEVILESTRGSYTKDACPWIPIRWFKVSGEDYGRAKVDDDIGDLRALESIHKAVVEVALASAKTLFFVNPNGQTNRKQVVKARNLEVLYGRATDVEILRVEKVTDLSVARSVSEAVERNIARSYLMQSSVQREGERVTATEIRYLANELETSLGGVYSLFSSEFQRPLVLSVMKQMMKRSEIPFLKENAISATVVAGVDALGRSHEAEQLLAALMSFGELMKNPMVAEYLKPNMVLKKLADARNIDISGLVMTEQEIAERRAQQMNQQLMERGIGPAAGQIARAATQGEPQ